MYPEEVWKAPKVLVSRVIGNLPDEILVGTWQSDLLNHTLRRSRVDSQHAVRIDPQYDLTLRIQILNEVVAVLALKFSCHRCRSWFVAHRCSLPLCGDTKC